MKKIFAITFATVLFFSGCANVDQGRIQKNNVNSNISELTTAEQNYVTSVQEIFTTIIEEMNNITSELNKATNAPSLYRNDEWKSDIEEGFKMADKMAEQLEKLEEMNHVPSSFRSEHNVALDTIILIVDAGKKIIDGINEINPRTIREGASIIQDSIDFIHNVNNKLVQE
ncbi:hypothetical protein [Paraliobacillus sp. JSM ZJ581]|uniref:hypothetical protein n=1 Tax=Paraliobacillus sp. JSM ZJ581 TaxID=3342118 RepID=UPI0035A8DC1B